VLPAEDVGGNCFLKQFETNKTNGGDVWRRDGNGTDGLCVAQKRGNAQPVKRGNGRLKREMDKNARMISGRSHWDGGLHKGCNSQIGL
jgi:hypothetical protein